jgi:methyltransferase (TIGR00027 family)
VVILGAGFDARACRLPEFQHGVRVFEIDHPATQAVKLKKLTANLGGQPAYMTYVPIDFNEQTLAGRLAESGYDERSKTLFIWQGVTQYLTPAAVDDTLAFVAEHSGAGSAIIFDYMDTSLLGGAPHHGEIRNMRHYRRLSGENLTFGIPQATIQEFLAARGFDRVQNADHVAFENAYFRGAGRRRHVSDGYAIVSAIVRRDS